MPSCTLLAPPTRENWPDWEFEHAMAHRQLLGAMSNPATTEPAFGTHGLARFSVLPYFIDPMRNTGEWHENHAQAHADFQAALPGFFEHAGGTVNPTSMDFTDMDFDDERLLTWWTWANFQQHVTAESVLPPTLVFPFW